MLIFLEFTGSQISEVRYEDTSISGYMGEKILEFKGYIWGGIIKRELWEKPYLF